MQVVNKWLVLQAMSDIPGNVKNVRALLDHPAFDIKNPNKVCNHFFPFAFNPSMVLLLSIYKIFFLSIVCFLFLYPYSSNP